MSAAPPMFSDRILGCLKAPGRGDDCRLELAGQALRCADTGELFPFVDGIPSLVRSAADDAPAQHSPEAITHKVRSFYEENPFPSYDGVEEFGALVSKGNQNPFTRRLLRSIGYNQLVLECGCGTGQMSHYLQLNNNHTLGVDLSLGSLALAVEHKKRNQLVRSAFAQMNLFDLALKDGSFDVVIAHGVLHHTYDARKAFAEVVRKAKPGGVIVVGLYNSYARVPTWLRSKLIGLLGPKIDYVVRSRIRDVRKADIWVKDQYYNPHETWHSIGETLDWFADNDVEFLNCIPPILRTTGESHQDLFTPSEPGTRAQRLVTQLAWLTTIAREGALFDLIGRRRPSRT
ncbi:MAG: class I SAM-dependent methyltransferase [Acidobacteriota bacterium]